MERLRVLSDRIKEAQIIPIEWGYELRDLQKKREGILKWLMR